MRFGARALLSTQFPGAEGGVERTWRRLAAQRISLNDGPPAPAGGVLLASSMLWPVRRQSGVHVRATSNILCRVWLLVRSDPSRGTTRPKQRSSACVD